MRPNFAFIMPLVARLTTRNVPVRLVSTTLVKSSSDMRSSSWSFVMPAFATSTSIGPSSASTCVKAASTDAVSVMSACTVRAPSGPPCPPAT